MAATEKLMRASANALSHPSTEKGESRSPRSRRNERRQQPGSCAGRLLGISLLLLYSGCDGNIPNLSADQRAVESRDNQSLGRPSIRSAKIIPSPLSRNTPLEVQVEVDTLNLLPVTFQYQWNVNGIPMHGETSRTFDPSRLKLGDRVSVDLIPVTVRGQGALYHVAESIVRNSLPMVRTVAIRQNEATINTRLEAHVDVVDVDHDLVRLTYRWRCNDRIVKEGEEAVLDPVGCHVGDQVTVEALPADLEEVGRGVRSEAVIIENSPPTVTAPPPPMANLNRYEYSVQAKDADGDPLRFSLAEGPAGMTIDKDSGRIVWVIPPGTSGKHAAKIVVEDNRGGSAIQDIELILSPAAGS